MCLVRTYPDSIKSPLRGLNYFADLGSVALEKVWSGTGGYALGLWHTLQDFGCLCVEKYNCDLHYDNVMFVAKATGGHSKWRIDTNKVSVESSLT